MNRIVFYDLVAKSIDRYLPEKYKKMPMMIKEEEILGVKTAFLAVKDKNGDYIAPLNMEPYLRKMQDGTWIQQVIKEMAEDYVKQIPPSKTKKKDRGEER